MLFAQQKIWNEQDCLEIVQETLSVVAQGYKTIDFEISFSAWAYRILENKIMNYYRAKKVKESNFSQIQETEKRKVFFQKNPLLENSLIKCLKKIHRFNKDHARILNLRYHGYEIGEISNRLGMTPNNIYVSLCRARKLLKACLNKEKG
jgi:RNA polymerase sigma factor (sigma-70 family)